MKMTIAYERFHGIGRLVWSYVAAICMVGGIVYIRMPETKGKPLP
jgi:hypothetical protein